MSKVLAIIAVGAWILFLAVMLAAAGRSGFIEGALNGAGLGGLVVVLIVLATALAALSMTSVLCVARWPEQVHRNRERLQRLPFRCGLAGLLALLLQLWITRLLPPGCHPLARSIWLCWDALALAQGFPALAILCGERITGSSGPRATALGTALFACGGSLPLLGWGVAAGGLLQAVGTHFLWGDGR